MTQRSHKSSVFICEECGRESLKWLGRCPECQGWNTFVETRPPPPSASFSGPLGPAPQELSQIKDRPVERLALPLSEFNRVLGGGIVPGSAVLIGGDPGIGKSTLLLQVSSLAALGGGRVVYVSGEESLEQIRLRAERLGVMGNGVFLLAETDIEAILYRLGEVSPSMVIVDSIQTVSLGELGAAPGSLMQVRESTMRLMRWAKGSAVPVLIAGHVTKEGAIAGPRVLEHMVDVVLYLEGEPYSSYRLLRGVKNRFGSTHEVGVFEMMGQGLVEVANPSGAFIALRPAEAIGSAVVPTLEGTRPFMVEIQALTTPTVFGLPRRTANGVDMGRLLLITAVLSKRVGLALGNQDIIVNVGGGFRISEPAADLGIALALASSFRNAEVNPDMVALGEVGLSGDVRPVPYLERRLSETIRLGFQSCLAPRVKSGTPVPPGIELIQADTLREAIKKGLMAPKRGQASGDPPPGAEPRD